MSVPARCVRCGTSFWASHAQGKTEVGWVFCPRCGQPTPSLPPRPRPPLFTWEVYRHFYPEPAWPRSPSPRTRWAMVLLSLVAGLTLLGIGGAFGFFVAEGVGPVHSTVGGTVQGWPFNGSSPSPLVGAQVTLNNVSGASSATVFTNSAGGFQFTNVPAGEHQLRVVAAGFRLSTMEIFLAPLFDEPSGNLSSLQVNLLQGPLSLTYDQPFAVFPDLETYLSYLLSASTIEVFGGLVALWGAVEVRRRRNMARGVVGACAGVLAPFLASVEGYSTLFLQLAPLTAVLGALAVVVAGTALLLLLTTQRPLDGVQLPPEPPPR